jgi:hypothetical protein
VEVATEIRQRFGDGRVHCVERGAVDVVDPQRGLEIVLEAAATVEHARLPLRAVERGGEGNVDRGPRFELTFISGFAGCLVGVGCEPAGRGHCNLLARDIDKEARRDVPVQSRPRE